MDKKVRINFDPLDSRQFIIAVKKLADSLTYGSDVSPFLGAGIDYMQSRLYQFGDPIKFIDWRVTGRTGRFHVKEYEAPKRMPFYILLDTSASMCVSSTAKSKYSVAVQVGVALALAGQQRLSPVGVLGCGERELHVKPTLSRGQVYTWAYALRNHDFLEKTSLATSATELSASLTDRSLIIVLSDLHDPECIPALKLVGQRHDLAVIQLQDPAERGKIAGGIFRAMEAETGKRFTAHGRKKWFDSEPPGKLLTRGGIDHLLISTDEVFLPKLQFFLRKRHLTGR